MACTPPIAEQRRSRHACARLVAALALGAAMAISACSSDPTQGYSFDSTFASTVRTVSVPIFANQTYWRDVQFDLADALVKEIESRTPWKVVDGAESDTLLHGTITTVTLTRLSKSPTTGLAEEDVISLTVDFEWRDQRTGRTLVQRKAFTANGLFVPTQTSNGPVEIGRFAAVQQLAADIVNTLRTQW
ncbi:MAG: LPS assembly lipoprotein LptE [Phycisphaerales bacterium]